MYNEKYSYFTDKLAEIIFRRTLDTQQTWDYFLLLFFLSISAIF